MLYSNEEFPLHKATLENDIDAVSNLLADLPKLACSVDDFGRTALHLSCKHSTTDLALIILQFTANLNAQDLVGKTCLHMSNSVEFVEIFCRHGADPNLMDDQGLTPLHLFVMMEKLDCVKVLLSYNANPTLADPIRLRTPLHLAASMGNLDMLVALLDYSKVPINLECPDVDGNTLVHIVASNSNDLGNQQKLMMSLLNRGASALTTNHMGISSLHFVCANRYLCVNGLAEPIIEVLLHLSADPNAQDNEGCTPLIIACAHREWNICRQLLEAGADMNIPCPMNSVLLQQGLGNSMFDKQECTASDLMPRKARGQLFPYLCAPQTRIPGESRDRCMDCGESFDKSSFQLFGSIRSSSSFTSSGENSPTSSVLRASNSNGSIPSPRQNGVKNSIINSSISCNRDYASNVSSGTSSVTSFFSLLQRNPLSSGKHRCRCCNRVVCASCSDQELSREELPDFCTVGSLEVRLRVCRVCFVFLSINSKK